MPTEPAVPRRLGPDARRRQLVRTGLDLVMTEPLEQITASAVAMAAGVSKGLVFHYFPTQRDLQAEIARAASEQLLGVLATVAPGGSYARRLRAGLEAFLCFVEQQPAGYAAVVGRAGADDQLNTVFEDFREGVVDLIAGALGLYDLTPRQRLYLRGWIAMVEEMILQWVTTRAISRDELIDHFVATASDGSASLTGD